MTTNRKILTLALIISFAPPALARLVVIIPPKLKQEVTQKIDYLKQIFKQLQGIDSKLDAINSKINSLPVAQEPARIDPVSQQITIYNNIRPYQPGNNSTALSLPSAPKNPWQVWNGSEYVDRREYYGR